MTKLIQPIPVKEFKSQIPMNTSCLISGWGFNDEYGSISEKLMVAKVPTRNLTECHALYDEEYEIIESMICTGYPNGGINTCYVKLKKLNIFIVPYDQRSKLTFGLQ